MTARKAEVKLPIALAKTFSYVAESQSLVEGISVLGRDQIEPRPRIERVTCFEEGPAQSSSTVWGSYKELGDIGCYLPIG